MSSGATVMGRPKQGADREPASPDSRAAIIHLKGSSEYADWLELVHRATHLPKSTIFRIAVAEWAERHGHPKPPEL